MGPFVKGLLAGIALGAVSVVTIWLLDLGHDKTPNELMGMTRAEFRARHFDDTVEWFCSGGGNTGDLIFTPDTCTWDDATMYLVHADWVYLVSINERGEVVRVWGRKSRIGFTAP